MRRRQVATGDGCTPRPRAPCRGDLLSEYAGHWPGRHGVTYLDATRRDRTAQPPQAPTRGRISFCQDERGQQNMQLRRGPAKPGSEC